MNSLRCRGSGPGSPDSGGRGLRVGDWASGKSDGDSGPPEGAAVPRAPSLGRVFRPRPAQTPPTSLKTPYPASPGAASPPPQAAETQN